MSGHLHRVLSGITLPDDDILALSGREGIITFLRCERDNLLYVFNQSQFRFSSLLRMQRRLGVHCYRYCQLMVCFSAISESCLRGLGYRQHLCADLRATPWGYELRFEGGERPEWRRRLHFKQ